MLLIAKSRQQYMGIPVVSYAVIDICIGGFDEFVNSENSYAQDVGHSRTLGHS